ncbi:hypothetical protein [Yoonia sp. 208BN28-4]|uniref:hypothetical protein n=1 Tax=Yoonia sp. 208BN28-4 TaxID=3126505 RepID=UPI00309BAC70
MAIITNTQRLLAFAAALSLAACAGPSRDDDTPPPLPTGVTDAENFAACIGKAEFDAAQPSAPALDGVVIGESTPARFTIAELNDKYVRVADMVAPEIAERMFAARSAARNPAATPASRLCYDVTDYSFSAEGFLI